MTVKDRLREELSRTLNGKEEKRVLIPALLGTIVNGSRVVEITRRPGFVYVRLRGNYSEQIEAYNDSVNTVYDLPVLVEKDRFAQNIYRVVGRDVGLYSTTGWPGGAGLAPHGDQHSFGYSSGSGTDIVWVFKRQFMPLLVHPHPDPNKRLWIQAEEDWYAWGRDYLHFTGATIDLAGAIPDSSSESRFMHFYVDADRQLKARTGTIFSTFPYPDNQTLETYIPELTVNEGVSLNAWLLNSSTTELDWKHFYDTRPILSGGNANPSNSFVLIDVSEGLRIEYPPTGPGFQMAIDASEDNDAILYPITTVTGTFTLHPNTTLIGVSEFSSKLIGTLHTANNTIDRINVQTYTTGIAFPLPPAYFPSITVNTGTFVMTNCVIESLSQLTDAFPACIKSFGTGSVFIRNSYLESHSIDPTNLAVIFSNPQGGYQIEAHYNTFAEYGDLTLAVSDNWYIANGGNVNHYANSWPYQFDKAMDYSTFREGDRQSIYTPRGIASNTVLDNEDAKIEADASGGSITITLPAITSTARNITIIKIDNSGYQVIIEGSGSETINGDLTLILEFQHDAATLASFSNGWRLV